MVISNETRNHEAQFSRNCIMEKSCCRYFKNIYDKIYMIKFHYRNTEKINRKKKLKSLHHASITSTPRPDHIEDINDWELSL